MSNKKQSSVEWLIEKLHNHSGSIDILDVAELNNYFEQSKAMHKEEIRGAYHQFLMSNTTTFEQYYKENYGE